jgi:fatty-acyl-CoA synthase
MSLTTHGACTVLQEAFDAAEALDLIERERCTVYFGQANIAHALVGHPAFRPERSASLRTGLTTGTPDDVRLTAEKLGVHGVCNIYGATEAYGQISVAWTGDPLEQRMNGQGPPLPGQTVRVVDPDTGFDVPEGELGEFWVKGYLMPGYLDDPEQTRAAFSDDGFFRTGDVGTIDGDGYLHFKARRKEMIKTGGISVSPLEVEAFLQGCAGVVEGCVVGLPHAVKGEVVAALVRLAPGSTLSAQDLRAQCKARMAAYKVPEIIVFVDELPRTETGKLSRKKSAELLAKTLEANAS